MKLRDSILILGGLALAGALLWMLMSTAGGPAEPGRAPVPEPASSDAVADTQTDPLVSEGSPRQSMVAGPVQRQLDPTGMTSGVIRGDIRLSPDVVERIQSITVMVQELASTDPNEPPFSRSQKVVYERATPSFQISGVPFSKNGYSVSVFSPGLNGSEQVVAVAETSPIADAILALSEPVPYSVRLRDQFHGDVVNTKVFMQPVDRPLGRPWLNGETDNFGSVLFEEVLAGDYLVLVGDTKNPVVSPTRVTVHPPGITVQPEPGFRGQQPIKHQYTWITVPRGKALVVSVTGVAGYGLKDARLTALPTNTVLYQPYEGVTDYSGSFVFPHMPAGQYELTVELEGHQRWTRNVRWSEDEDPPQVEVRLIPRRNF